MRSRYSRWDGTQSPLGEEIDIADLMERLADELMAGYGGGWALRRLQQEGVAGRFPGLDDLRARLRSARRELASRTNNAGPLEHVRRRLEEVLETERAHLDELPEDDAALKHAELDLLPRGVAAALKGLGSYSFTSPEARARYEALMEDVRREVLESYFKDVAGAIKDMSPEDIARLKDMLAELNHMIEARDRGDDYDFKGFMQRYGDFFPEDPKDLDELLSLMARRMAAASRLMAGMTPEQRRELAELAGAVLDDLDLAFQVDRLGRTLRELMPAAGWDEGIATGGDGMLPMSQTVDAIERIAEMDELDGALSGGYAGANLDDVDEEVLGRILGDDSVHDLRRLKEIEKELERAGALRREEGELRLTAKGARLLGERSLTKLLERIRRTPTHRAPGGQSEPTGATRQWRFGDEDPLSVERTVYNAVTRSGPGRPVGLEPGDFEVQETETRPRTATALLLDLSFSMPLRGHWIPAKRMALALHALIEGKHPQDSLYLIGFSDYARRMEPRDLAAAGWEEVHGTNMQHAFMLARRCLADDPRAVKQVVMVTDGEPTAHLVGERALFHWPPVRETIDLTLKEAVRLARSGIAIDVFMLEESPGLTGFMRRLATLTGGEVHTTPSGEVGAAVVGGYLRRQTQQG